jgi:antitoxin component YwqK of YwqJK toxin-antitoxin module
MKAAVKYMCSAMLFVSMNCNDRNNGLVLRQIMREEDGSVCKRVYAMPEDPDKELVEVYFKDGTVKEQYCRKNGVLEGFRLTYYSNGQVSESGNWRDNQRIGLFLYYKIDGGLDCSQVYRK